MTEPRLKNSILHGNPVSFKVKGLLRRPGTQYGSIADGAVGNFTEEIKREDVVSKEISSYLEYVHLFN